jgi:RNA polymerase sigma-70 factor (ECF subfamily)
VDIPQDVLLDQFEGWYEHQMPRLFAFVCYRLGDQAAAEDLTALICEKAMTNLHRYDAERGDMGGWIYGIARHEVQRYRRDYRRAPAMISLGALPNMQASGASIEEIFQRTELTRCVIQHLGNLPERDQEIVALRYGAELSHNQIAEMLGLSTGNVRVLLHRALDKLHQILIHQYEAADHE